MRNRISPADLRIRAELTQQDVAIALNKSVSTISKWERFAKRPKLSFAETLKLTRLYRVTLEDLVRAFDRVDPDEI